MERKMILIKKETYDKLSKMGTVKDTMNSIIEKLIQNQKK